MVTPSTETSQSVMSTTITEYSTTETALSILREKYSGIKFDVATTKGMDEAKKVRAEIKGYRVALEAKRIEIKAPALRRCQQIDAEAKRITTELLALENPVDEQIKAEEKRKKDEKEAKEKSERDRIAAIQNRISNINNLPLQCINMKSGELMEFISGKVEPFEIDDTFAEFKLQAEAAKGSALTKLWEMVAAKQNAEELAEKIRLEREQLDQEKAERDRLQAEEDEKARLVREEEDRKAKAARDEEDRIAKEKRDAEQAELDRQRKALEEQQRIQSEQQAAEAANVLKSAGPLSALTDIHAIAADQSIDDQMARSRILAIAEVFQGDQHVNQ